MCRYSFGQILCSLSLKMNHLGIYMCNFNAIWIIYILGTRSLLAVNLFVPSPQDLQTPSNEKEEKISTKNYSSLTLNLTAHSNSPVSHALDEEAKQILKVRDRH